MKNIAKYILLAGVSAAALTSCDLDLYPTTSIVWEEGMDVITMDSDLQSLQNGLMANFRSRTNGTYWKTEEIMFDAFNAVVDYGNNNGQLHRQEQAIVADYEIEDVWAGHYSAIKNYNIFIDAANNMKSTNEKLRANAQIAKGYAFMYRADSYLVLARHFGNAYGTSASSDLCVPIITKFNISELPARNTVAEVYAQIKADLDSAAVILKDTKGAVRSEKPNMDAVNFLYARYYLDTKDYAKAAAAAESVINSAAGYKLASTLEEMMAEFRDDKGKEPIIQMFANLSEGSVGTTDFTAISNQTSQGYGYVYHPLYMPSKKLIDAYDKDDLRFQTWFTDGSVSPSNWNNKADGIYTYIDGGFYKGQFYIFTRWEGNPALTTSGIPGGGNAAKPYTLPEMYLIAAEAYAQAGNSADAVKYLNALQAARGAKVTTASMDNIKKEWFKETVGQGQRLICLKRWNDGFGAREAQPGALAAGVVATGAKYEQLSMPAGDYHLTWPVPKYEMDVNPNLVQNGGYTIEES